MCGIAGIWQGDYSPEVRSGAIARMTKALRHRGPDGGDHYVHDDIALGHRRLSIIAPDASANQPMRRGNLVTVYNGELYNYREERTRLEEKGITFITKSDTEVLLALYEDEGEACLARLNGIFAFAIYDEAKKRLFCARDQFGIKPFLYAQTKNGIVFASELKSILASSLVQAQINMTALELLMQAGSVPQPLTMLHGVESLLPGHYMVMEAGCTRIEQYYKIKAGNYRFSSAKDWEEGAYTLLNKTISQQMVSDVALGAFLSGGVDSGLIAAMMRKSSLNVKTFSVGFEKHHVSDQYDETSEAAEVARYIGTDHEVYTIMDADIENELPNIISALDHPSIDGINSYFVSKVTSRRVRVALSGTGADEVFAGYAWFENMQKFETENLFKKLFRQLKGQNFKSYYGSLHGAYSPQMAASLLRYPVTGAIRYLPDPLEFSSTLSRTSGLVMGSFLQNQLLPDIDTASMAHGLEVRVPYLSPAVVEMALAMPDELKLSHPDSRYPAGSYAASGTKKILIDIARPYLPQGFDLKPKRGFAMPMNRWLRTVWKQYIEYYLSEDIVVKRGLFNYHAVADLKRRYEEGTAPWTQLWLLLAVEIWCQHVMEAKHTP